MLNPTTVYVVAAIFLATLVRSTFGFGEALIAVPLLAVRLPITIAAPLAVVLSILIAGVIVVQDRRHVHLWSAIGLLASSLPGIPIGVLLLVKGNGQIVKLLLGVLIIAFSIYSLIPRAAAPHQPATHPGWLLACGFASGVLGGAYGMNGPPLVVYGALRRWTPQHFRATLQGYFLPASLTGLIAYVAMGLWKPALTRYCLLSLPAVAVAVLLGRAINRRMTHEGFFRFVYMGLIVVGGVLLAQSLFW